MFRPDPTASPGPVRTVVRIKARILTNSLRSHSLRNRMLVSILITVLISGAGVRAVLANANSSTDDWGKTLVTLFTITLATWLFAPLAFGGQDDTVDPSRLSLLPLTERELRLSVLAASLLGFLPLAMMTVLVSVVVGYASGWATLLIVVSAVLQFLLCLLASRALGGALAFAATSRRGRDVTLMIASLGAVALWGATQSLAFVSERTYARILRVLELIPSGMGAKAIVDARTGHPAASAIRLGFVAISIGVLYVAWAWLFRRNLLPRSLPRRRRKPPSAAAVARRGTRSANPQSLWRVLLTKELRYLARSPHRRASLAVGIVLGGPFILVQFFSKTVYPESVYLAPLAVVFSLGSVNNLLGFDAPSLWLEVTSGAPFRTIVMCRSLATAPFVVLPILSSATVMAVVAGFGRHYAAVLVLTIAGCGVPLGVGCLASVMVPFPQEDADDPFSDKRPTTGEGCLVGLVTAGTMGLTFIILSPIALVGIRLGSSGESLAALCVLTATYSWVVWFLCADYSGGRAQRRSSELLSALMERGVTA